MAKRTVVMQFTIGVALTPSPERASRASHPGHRNFAVARHGFREYYNPLTGCGLAARRFGFATLLVDLLAECGFDGSEPSGRARMMQA